ncbi:ABC transporter permease [Thermus sp.]|uniref:ABC transporter permease n=1 Tax=Thermus sp. TaxID=275 RepID=UPI002630A12B|nr:ABC transporter permease [Thermus sp.]MCS7216269.1 ABC transporter permease [Candidatus Bipolaricaulota bacterium]MCX7850244.1 ABC transporter permease [Thermus sp.]MDW8151499.1 ABC transporter permease [Candidatus Bipolaricaulota bacterium]
MTWQIRTFLRTVVGRAYPRFIGVWREKSWVIFDVFFPLLQVSAYVYIYRAIGAPPEFAGFAVLGGAMIAYWMNVLWSMASQLYWEKETGNLQLYLIAPTSRMAILLGMALGGLTATTVRAAGVILVGALLFRIPLRVGHGALFLGVFLLTLVALYGLGMLLSSVFLLWGREAWHLSNLFMEPVYLFSGFYFPVRALGFWVALVASVIPITLGLDALRQLLYPQLMERFRFLPVEAELGALAALAVLFLFLAHRGLRFFEELARREGRLTLRGQ